MKLAREALAHFLDSSWKKDPTKAEWEIIGEDIEDMSVDLNPDVSSKKTILGKTKTSDERIRAVNQRGSVLRRSIYENLSTYPRNRNG